METQSPKVRAIYDVVSTFFADILFNHVYNMAKARKTDSMYDSFTSCVNLYVSSARSDKRKFDMLSQQLYKYFITMTIYSKIGYTDFVNTIVGASTPEKHFMQFTIDQKSEIFDSIVCDVLTNMSSHCLQPDMVQLLVGPNRIQYAGRTTENMRNYGIEIMFSKRSDLFSKLFKQSEQVRSNHDAAIFVNTKIELRETLKKKIALEALVESQADRMQLMEMKFEKSKSKMQRKIDELEQYVDKLKDKLKHANGAGGGGGSGRRRPPNKKYLKYKEEESGEEESGEEESGEEESGEEESGEEESGEEESGEEESDDNVPGFDIIEDEPKREDNKIPSRPPNPRDEGYQYLRAGDAESGYENT